jgi:hypothetical protein
MRSVSATCMMQEDTTMTAALRSTSPPVCVQYRNPRFGVPQGSGPHFPVPLLRVFSNCNIVTRENRELINVAHSIRVTSSDNRGCSAEPQVSERASFGDHFSRGYSSGGKGDATDLVRRKEEFRRGYEDDRSETRNLV